MYLYRVKEYWEATAIYVFSCKGFIHWIEILWHPQSCSLFSVLSAFWISPSPTLKSIEHHRPRSHLMLHILNSVGFAVIITYSYFHSIITNKRPSRNEFWKKNLYILLRHLHDFERNFEWVCSFLIVLLQILYFTYLSMNAITSPYFGTSFI